MEYKQLKYNAGHLKADLKWLEQVLQNRLESLSENNNGNALTPAPELKGPASVYAKFLKQFQVNDEERLILILSLQPFLAPGLLEKGVQAAGKDPGSFPDLGGVKSSRYNGMLPTGETVMFILAGKDLATRIRVGLYFSPQHFFYTKSILKLDETDGIEPETSGVLMLSPEVRYMLTSATRWLPVFNSQFPAKEIRSAYEWEDLVLNPDTEMQLEELKDWLDHRKVLLTKWGFDKHFHQGYKALFHGPAGTGKSLATALLGKRHKMPVYRIDLSMVISKYIGETEKNLSRIFDAAAGKEWILFFDEADALFGKRTNVQNANDRFANQEVSYLLMRMEEYDGLAILATNLQANIDRAFLRRFQSVVHFGLPDSTQRLKIWEKGFPEKLRGEDIDLRMVAEKFALSGAQIMNVIRYSCIRGLKENKGLVTMSFIIDGIRRELSRDSGLSGE